MNSVKTLTMTRSGPVMSARNITVIFSDSGQVQAKLYGSRINRYESPEAFLEFPEGFKVTIFDSAMQVQTIITGKYGIRKESLRTMEAKGNVVVRNVKENKQLNTENLVWDEFRRTIVSKVPVKITTGDMILFGDGLESDESFSKYTILNPHGQMMVKKDSI